MRRSVLVLLALAVLVLFSACATKRKALVAPQVSFQEAEQAGVTLSLQFLDEPLLKRRFGTDENPFLTQYSRMFLRRIVVFELAAANDSEDVVELRPTECQLDFRGKTLAGITRLQLVNYWDTADKNPKTSRGKQRTAEKYLLANQSKIAPGGSLRGYLVFQGELPDSGTAGVSVPLESASGPLRLDFTFEF